MAKYVTSRELAERVKTRIGYNTTQRDLAREMGISEAYLSDFLAGKREAGPRILAALGYDIVPHYRRVRS